MQNTDFEAANHTLERPPGWDEDECDDLQIMVGRHPMNDGKTAIALVSCWQPTEQERKAIANGANIYLHVLARKHPPVLLSTGIHADRVQVDPPGPSTRDGQDPDA